jgi:hypothetical protein
VSVWRFAINHAATAVLPNAESFDRLDVVVNQMKKRTSEMMKNTVNETEQMVVSRILDALRELVWQAWTDPNT